jgi:predicted signal transduction protein with EAL and GGDEF domain
LARYEAKAAGNGVFQGYSHSSAIKVHERINIRDELNQAIEKQEFVLWYQALVRAV